MTGPIEFSLKNVAETIKNLGFVMGAFVATTSIMAAVVWWIVEPRVQPYIDRIESIDTIQRDMSILAGRDEAALRPFVEFRHQGFAWPTTVKPGDTVQIVYVFRRNEPCTARSEVLYWNLARRSYDERFAQPSTVFRAPVTRELVPFPLVLTVPEGLASGVWLIFFVITGEGECAGDPPVTAPPAAVFVEARHD